MSESSLRHFESYSWFTRKCMLRLRHVLLLTYFLPSSETQNAHKSCISVSSLCSFTFSSSRQNHRHRQSAETGARKGLNATMEPMQPAWSSSTRYQRRNAARANPNSHSLFTHNYAEEKDKERRRRIKSFV